METCSVIQKARLVLIALLTVFSALCAARSSTASIDTDHTATTESYFPLNDSDLEKSTVLPTEFVSTAPSSTRGTFTDWGNSTSTEITDPLIGFSTEQQPPSKANSATEVNANTDASMDTEKWESPSLTDGTYTSSTISRAGERTLLSVTSNNTTPYTEHSSPYSKKPSPYSENTSTFSEKPSSYSENPPLSSMNPSSYSEKSSHYSQESNSSQAPTRDERSGSTVNVVVPDRATSTQFDQSDTTSRSSSSHSPNISETGSPSDVSQQSSTNVSDSTSNSTPPFTESGDREGTDTTHFGHTSQTGTSQSETRSSVSSGSAGPHTENNTPNMSGPAKESTITTISASGTATESTMTFHTPVIAHTEASSTATSRVNDAITATDKSPNEPATHRQPSTSDTEQTLDPTEALVTTQATASHNTQSAEEHSFQVTTGTTTTTTTTTATTIPVVTPSPYQSSTSMEPSTQPATTAPTHTTPRPQATPATSQHLPATRTGSAATSAISTDITTLHMETSTATPGSTARHTTVSYSNTAPSRTTPAHTTGNLTDRATTAFEATTTQMHIESAVVPGSPCDSNPCVNGGTCVVEDGKRHRCVCLPSWTGKDCEEDMDECVSSPCPHGSTCVNTRGSFSCVCPLGSDLEHGRICTRARTFLGTFELSNMQYNSTRFSSTDVHELHREIIQLLNASLSILKGYIRSTLNKSEGDVVHFSAVHTFSMSAQVTRADVTKNIDRFLKNCSQTVMHCREAVHLSYKAESLCAAQETKCDTERTNCTDNDGTTFCQCHAGYFKHNTEDLSCRECDDGYKLENGTCVRCTFGFGGFNCGNFYKLITVVVSPASGVLLLILIIALIVTCCKKDKNDINKIIFRSGDFQMSPYAEYPKNNRVSVEWGRETIEMQENGSTKNLLQMTDIYYSPALRNSELERSGLYPFSGMPGSRHSCIYPAQWNPSFISDDTRRRDYF
ncbi:hypothetical protein AGOR_G00061080 [Albula goreensis]|uniref:EGF-like domain-containing protein n=1 Tax=Albula goreensis TaxID=1534307 RepID=A0A8T3DSS7_9TELE|nr:hypothetical protein AGOR_G00061080 [Albula goreensis]